MNASNAGGAIDFAAPVVARDVEPLMDAQIRSARDELSVVGVVLGQGHAPLAFAVLYRPVSPVQQHWASLTRVMVDPAHQRQGIGRLLVQAMHDIARQLSLTQLRLTARSGHGLEEFYAQLGFEIIGRHPDGVQLEPGQFRDEIIMLITV